MKNDKILELLKSKASLKQEIFAKSLAVVDDFKAVVKECVIKLREEFGDQDSRVRISSVDKGKYAGDLTIGSDVLVFFMHSNVFKIPSEHSVWKTSYLKENPDNGYCSIVHIYNFLSDSITYNREDDYGYLIARVFVNKERHFFVEGRERLDFEYRDFMHDVLDKEKIEEVLIKCIEYAIDFDLESPPFKNIEIASVHQLNEANERIKMKTGKRLGFKFQNEQEDII